jgi:hypothetical protein
MRRDPRFQLAEDEQRLFDFLSEDLCRNPAAGSAANDGVPVTFYLEVAVVGMAANRHF